MSKRWLAKRFSSEKVFGTLGFVRRKRGIILITGLILVSIGFVVFWGGEREPRYQGKRLSEWLFIVGTNLSGAELAEIEESHNFNKLGSAEALRAARAVRSIGTNALPHLVKWISYDRARWDKVLDMYDKLPRVVVSDRAEDWIIGDRNRKRNLAVLGFDILKEDAAAAVPNLVNVVGYAKSKSCRYDALLCLRMIGATARPAIPELKEIALKAGDNSSVSPEEILLTVEVIEAGGMTQFMTLMTNKITEAGH